VAKPWHQNTLPRQHHGQSNSGQYAPIAQSTAGMFPALRWLCTDLYANSMIRQGTVRTIDESATCMQQCDGDGNDLDDGGEWWSVKPCPG